MSASEDNTPGSLSEPEDLSPEKNDEDGNDLADDLFGDGDDDALDEDDVAPTRRRRIDDEELDSGDDEGRADRAVSEGGRSAVSGEEVQVNTARGDFPRHAIPQPSDNELALLKVPRFLSFEPTAYSHKDFQPPVTDHHSKAAPSSSFSAYNTALTTIRWRRSPSNPTELQSNARILRWSDGSLTLQFASTPTSQFEMTANALCRPAHKPDAKFRPLKRSENKDNSFSYLAAASPAAGFLRVTNRVTMGLQVMPSGDTADEALERLQSSIAAAKRGSVVESADLKAQINLVEDPETQKRQAEAAEREKTRAQRRMENALNKERERSNRAFGRSGYGGRPGGLTIGDLEGGDGRPKANRPKPRRRRPEYSSDEDDYGRRYNKEDDYDAEDGFIAPSDEEEEVEDDEDEDLDEGIEEEPAARSKASPKRAPVDRDAEGEDDDDEIAAPRGKRRRVIESDDEE